jgi:hypothetical protein
VISAELAGFLESGISVLVGTRDGSFVPESARALGARVEPGGEELTVFLPAAYGARTVANLKDNGRVAVCFSRPADHRTLQLKGALVELRDATAEERERVDRYRGAYSQTLGFLGLPPRTVLRIAHWPCHAVRFRVEHVYVQTPGPRAGEPLPAAQP